MTRDRDPDLWEQYLARQVEFEISLGDPPVIMHARLFCESIDNIDRDGARRAEFAMSHRPVVLSRDSIEIDWKRMIPVTEPGVVLRDEPASIELPGGEYRVVFMHDRLVFTDGIGVLCRAERHDPSRWTALPPRFEPYPRDPGAFDAFRAAFDGWVSSGYDMDKFPPREGLSLALSLRARNLIDLRSLDAAVARARKRARGACRLMTSRPGSGCSNEPYTFPCFFLSLSSHSAK